MYLFHVGVITSALDKDTFKAMVTKGTPFFACTATVTLSVCEKVMWYSSWVKKYIPTKV